MAHFAKIGLNNTVLTVIKIDDSEVQDADGNDIEERGVRFLKNLTGHETWVQCSINTVTGVHLLNKIPLRKNFPSPGWVYDSYRDAFVEPHPDKVKLSTWIFNEATCRWQPPVPYPNDSKRYKWNDETSSWDEIPKELYYI